MRRSGLLLWVVLAALGSLLLWSSWSGDPLPPAPANGAAAPGAVVATGLAMVASLGVSYYVTRLASYQSLYGTFGSAMVVVLWFYACSLAVMIGAVVNTELRVPSDPAWSRY